MPTTTGGTTRTQLSELIKGVGAFENEAYVDYCFSSVAVKAASSTTTDNIGIPLKWNPSTSAYNIFTANPAWAASTAVTVGYVVKPATQDGYEYVCVKAGTTHTAAPTFVAIPGATTTETSGVIWLCRKAYSGVKGSLPDGSEICVLVGSTEGAGFNRVDTTLSTTAVTMPVIYRGIAALAKDGFTWGSVASADQNEFYAALERKGITVITSGTTVTPVFTS